MPNLEGGHENILQTIKYDREQGKCKWEDSIVILFVLIKGCYSAVWLLAVEVLTISALTRSMASSLLKSIP